MQNKIVSLYFSNRNHGSLLEIVLKALDKMNAQVLLFLADGLEQYVFPKERIILEQTIWNTRFTPQGVFEKLNESDFVILDQLYSLRELYSFSSHKIGKPTLLLVHNCNTWFRPRIPTSLVPFAKHVMTQKVRKQISYFAVAGENMLEYSKKELRVKNVGLIPFRYDDFNPKTDLSEELYSHGNRIRLVVPGMISDRRNYLELLEVVATEALKEKVELVLLGKPDGTYGQKILIEAEALQSQGYMIRYWKGFIPQEEFEKEIREAHLLFSYFHPEYITNNGQLETYGVSKETGIVLLMYNKAKVGILPASFRQMKTIQNQTLTFEDFMDLKSLLLKVYTGEIDLQVLTQNAIQNARAMKLQLIIDQISMAFSHQIKNS
ncbi:hypothetical protein LZF95_11470 [Algoriphagus sp. AGSA1]|uniref:hypothetical protein n=1 Tax=Algoriphagus sp. AGSA1 TaxID=2907213 RepID=UPI001F2E6217|nr:hypothetical protein [Algoriphagus sp. AGSA1]MCE7055296.1 hypothetical protein [Algoriphagus sp. AGSA1]